MPPLSEYPELAAGAPPSRTIARDPENTTSLFTLSGRIEDETGLPLSGALVTLELRVGIPVAHTTTDAEGRFVFTGLAEGHYLIVVQKSHFDTERQVVDVSRSSVFATLTLHSSTEVLGEKKAPWDINTSGPNYTGTADVEPAGSWYYEPWVYDSIVPRQGATTYRIPQRLAVGLGHDLELDIWQTVLGNYQGYPSTPRGVHVGDWGFGNFHLQLKYPRR
jgi:hypothetical protein